MTDDFRYDTALAAALGVISSLDAAPRMPRQEKLAKVTYAILDAIRRAEDRLRASGSHLPMPKAEAAATVRCRLVSCHPPRIGEAGPHPPALPSDEPSPSWRR